MKTKGDEDLIKRIKKILSKIQEPTTGLDLITGDFIQEIEIDFTRIIIRLKGYIQNIFHQVIYLFQHIL